MERVRSLRADCILGFTLSALWLTAGSLAGQEYQQAYNKLKADWARAFAENKAPYDKTLDAAENAYQAVSVANARIALAGDNEKEKKDAQAALKTASATAFTQYKLALAKLPEQTEENREKQIEVLYRTAFLSYQNKEYSDAATLAEFIARKYPKNKFAVHSAKIAITTRQLIYNATPKAERGDVLVALTSVCAYTAQEFKETKEGQEAQGLLAKLALSAGDIEVVKKMLPNFPKGSEEYNSLLMQIGQVQWFNFFQETSKPPARRLKPDQLAGLKNEAKQAFKEATETMRKDKQTNARPSLDLLKAELSLVQIYNMDGQFAEAKKLLELPKSGLNEHARLNLKVIHPIKDMRQMIFTSALKTYLGLRDFANAEDVAQRLAALGGGKSDPKAMTTLLGSLAKQLFDDFKAKQAAGATREELLPDADSLAGLLGRLADREEGHTYQTLVWPAEKLYELGEVFNTEEGPSEKSREFFQQSVAVYNKILERREKEPEFVTESNVNAIQEKVAGCQRALGNNKEAQEMLIAILRKFPNRVPAQLEAAYVYQDLAGESGKVDDYELAIKGGEPLPAPDLKGPDTNVVWGWHKLARMTQQSAQHESLYYEARYNLAFCRMQRALLSDNAERTQGLIDSLNDVRVTYVLDHNLGDKEGDDKWKSRYDALTKKLQALLEQDPVGLEGLKPGSPGSVERAKLALAKAAEEEPGPASPTNFVAIAIVALLGGGAVLGIIYYAYLKPKRPSVAYRRR